MGTRYNSLAELIKKKDIVKEEVKDMEKILRFENIKKSLSVLTNGATDQFIKEKSPLYHSEENKDRTGRLLNKKNANNSAIENALHFSSLAFVLNLAKKNLNHSNWKKKVLGILIVYGAPILLRKVSSMIEEWQEKEKQKNNL
ncbi:hypothetical protein GNY06_07010 [Elizabethkingia argentiflava]|uniref:Phosphoribosyl-ATP pyrophosphatase n=1 Tax=Elizabethkingia argenteiflava TaxID=2681556 RepID=A0A845PVH4_9FLAO|nr:hypothetical protein [Elizabethkingia argenteiflava]NAW51133.1 hypothetical protein [Elizabethkingia argenteiflava]